MMLRRKHRAPGFNSKLPESYLSTAASHSRNFTAAADQLLVELLLELKPSEDQLSRALISNELDDADENLDQLHAVLSEKISTAIQRFTTSEDHHE